MGHLSFQDIGFVLAFYAISPTSFMLIDYSELHANVKQTGIIVSAWKMNLLFIHDGIFAGWSKN